MKQKIERRFSTSPGEERGERDSGICYRKVNRRISEATPFGLELTTQRNPVRARDGLSPA